MWQFSQRYFSYLCREMHKNQQNVSNSNNACMVTRQWFVFPTEPPNPASQELQHLIWNPQIDRKARILWGLIGCQDVVLHVTSAVRVWKEGTCNTIVTWRRVRCTGHLIWNQICMDVVLQSPDTSFVCMFP